MLFVQGHQKSLVLLPTDPGKASADEGCGFICKGCLPLCVEKSIILFYLAGFSDVDKKETYSKSACGP